MQPAQQGQAAQAEATKGKKTVANDPPPNFGNRHCSRIAGSRHCDPADERVRKNQHCTWWVCRGCGERLRQLRNLANSQMWYFIDVPPCELTCAGQAAKPMDGEPTNGEPTASNPLQGKPGPGNPVDGQSGPGHTAATSQPPSPQNTSPPADLGGEAAEWERAFDMARAAAHTVVELTWSMQRVAFTTMGRFASQARRCLWSRRGW